MPDSLEFVFSCPRKSVKYKEPLSEVAEPLYLPLFPMQINDHFIRLMLLSYIIILATAFVAEAQVRY